MGAVSELKARPAQADRQRELGCPLGQGFLYARPAPAAELENLLGGLSAARAA